jgi:hypothetical protein
MRVPCILKKDGLWLNGRGGRGRGISSPSAGCGRRACFVLRLKRGEGTRSCCSACDELMTRLRRVLCVPGVSGTICSLSFGVSCSVTVRNVVGGSRFFFGDWSSWSDFGPAGSGGLAVE